MKILLCTSEHGIGAGGLALHCSQLKKIFETLGHTVYVEILLNYQEYFVIDGGYDPELGKKIRGAYMLKGMIAKYHGKVDLCVSCGAGRIAYYSSLFAKNEGIDLYIVLCGSEVNLSYESADLAFYNAESFRYASAVIGLSEELNNAARMIGENKSCRYYVVPNIYEMKEGHEADHEDRDYVVYASGATYLGEKKGIGNLLKAFSLLINSKKRNDRLYLFGDIDSDVRTQYERIIEEESLKDYVSIYGYMDRESFHNMVKDVDVYLQASPFEGFGNSVAEAISMGKDILISSTGYIAEIIADEFPNHVMKSFKPEDMADDLFDFSVKTYPKREAVQIRKKLTPVLSKETVFSQWKSILRIGGQTSTIIDGTRCMAVMFHDVGKFYTGIDYAKDGFEKLLASVHEAGYRLCSARDFFSARDRVGLIVCTFDDGYENVYVNALPAMKQYGFTATVYICPDLIGKDNSWNHKDDTNRKHMNGEMLKTLVDAGWEIGSHGMSHMNMLRLSEHEIDESLSLSKKLLEEYDRTESFCYPYGSFNEFVKNKVKKYYSNAFSVSIGGNDFVDDPYQLVRMTPEKLLERLELDI